VRVVPRDDSRAHLLMTTLTPAETVRELDRYIIGQQPAKRAVAIALRNRYRRMQLPEDLRDEVTPKNILMIGPTGVGKTEIARRIARLTNAPFLKVDVTKFTQVGYVGRDVESIVRDLLDVSINLVQTHKESEVRLEAEKRAQERILSFLMKPANARDIEEHLPEDTAAIPSKTSKMAASANGASAQAVAARRSARTRKQRIREALLNLQLEEHVIEIEVENGDPFGSVIEYMTTISGDDPTEFMPELITSATGGHKRTRRMTVREARRLLAREEMQKLLDTDQILEEATRQVEQHGIVFLDEIDKIVGSKVDTGPDVAGEGVQRDLLPIVEGTTVATRYGTVKTDHILWIAAGAFHKHKPADLIPELQGRFPLRVELDNLSEADFIAILSQPEHALTRQYQALLATEDVKLEFTEDGIAAMAHYAFQMNAQTENIGARRLHTIMERVLEDASFQASENKGQTVVVDADYVRDRLEPIAGDEDLNKYIL
jgi:ATP-dependent HslUV protease ATP-binding subunit HslU